MPVNITIQVMIFSTATRKKKADSEIEIYRFKKKKKCMSAGKWKIDFSPTIEMTMTRWGLSSISGYEFTSAVINSKSLVTIQEDINI